MILHPFPRFAIDTIVRGGPFVLRQQLMEFAPSERSLDRFMRDLIEAGAVRTIRVCVRDPLPVTSEPLAVIEPGEPPPDPNRASRRAQRRWKGTCARFQPAFAATRSLLLGFGLPPRGNIQVLKATHDAALASVWLTYNQQPERQQQAKGWHCEAAAPFEVPQGEKRPDAYILADDGKRILRVVEFAGAYPPSRIEAFSRFCLEKGYSAELW